LNEKFGFHPIGPLPRVLKVYGMESKEKTYERAATTIRAKATTQNILGPQSGHHKVQPRWSRHHEALRRLRDQILAKKEAFAKDANVNGESNLLGEHMADAATDSYDRDWALSMLSSEQNALYEIEQALDRMTRGTYGICELTGRPIESGRLLAIPWTRFCTAAQIELEAKGAVGRTQLAELGSYYGPEELEEAVEEEEKEVK